MELENKWSSVKIPSELLILVESKVTAKGSNYVSVADFVRNAVRQELRGRK